MAGYALETGDPPEWVSVEVHRKLVTAWCRRCLSGTSLYWTVIAKQRDAVRIEVDRHRACEDRP